MSEESKKYTMEMGPGAAEELAESIKNELDALLKNSTLVEVQRAEVSAILTPFVVESMVEFMKMGLSIAQEAPNAEAAHELDVSSEEEADGQGESGSGVDSGGDDLPS